MKHWPSPDKQEQFTAARVLDSNDNEIAHWEINSGDKRDMIGGLVSKWLYPRPIEQKIWHNGKVIGEMHLTGTDITITHFVWLSPGVLTACILLASAIAIFISRYLHRGLDQALQNITDVVHDVRANRNFSRRVPPEKIEEFHIFSQDFNSLLDEMKDWHQQLQRKNTSLQRSALHDPLTSLANRASFRMTLDKLLLEENSDIGSALLFMDGDNFKSINDTWGHAAGDLVLIEVAKRLMLFTNSQQLAFHLGGDESALFQTATS